VRGRGARVPLLAGLVLIAAAVLASARPVQAHALLLVSSPADGASVEQAPAQMLLVFTEALDPVLSTVRVVDASGDEVTTGRAQAVPGQPAQLRVPLGPLAEGTYTANWRVTSPADGHTTVGAVAFGVGVPAVPAGTASEATEAPGPVPTLASTAGRWLFYAGAVVLLGAAVVGVWVASTPAVVSRRMLAAAWAAAGAGVALTVADQRATARTDLGTLLSSSTGHRLAVHVAAVAACGVAVAWACRHRRRSRAALAVVGVAASAAMLARALAGHANASSPRWFTVGTQWVHLLAVGAWIGGLVWFLVALRRGDPGQGRGLARRFSWVAAWALALAVVSGTVRALDEVGAWRRLLGTDFGLTLLAKTGLVAALFALGAISRFRHVPAAAVTTGATGATGATAATGGLRRVVRAEVAVAAGILGATALLTGFPPSSTVAAASRAGRPPNVVIIGTDEAGSVRVRLVVTPGSAGPNRFDAAVQDPASGDLLRPDAVTLRFRLADRPDLPAATLNLVREPDWHWRGAGTGMSVEGRWTITALVQSGETDAVEVAMDLVTGAASTGATAACGEGTPDPAYTVTVDTDPDPPRAEGTTLRLVVRDGGRPVPGANVCVKFDMPDMGHPGVFGVAHEVSAGRYEARLRFSMSGGWVGSAVIAPPGRQAVSVALRFEVR
jgi:copper transport protein